MNTKTFTSIGARFCRSSAWPATINLSDSQGMAGSTMKRKKKRSIGERIKSTMTALAMLALVILNSELSTARAQGTAFTYQGQLMLNGSPAASGSYSMIFTLYEGPTGTSPTTYAPVTASVTVSGDGLFSQVIDFGAAPFTPPALPNFAYWLQIQVEPPGGSTYTTLTPNQELTPDPYSIYAENVPASGIFGTLGNSQLTYNSVTVTAGTGLTGGGTVPLGGSITLNATGSPVSSVTSLTPDITVSPTTGAVTLNDNAASLNTPNYLVKRDGSGSFTAQNITLDGTITMPDGRDSASPDIINTAAGLLLMYDDYNGNSFVGQGAGNTTMINLGGFQNTATGTGALAKNMSGEDNTATGIDALNNNTSGAANTATGAAALAVNTSGSGNTANGDSALYYNTTGSNNTADGSGVLLWNVTGSNNTAVGEGALGLMARITGIGGSSNIAVGYEAGINYVENETGNIDIGNAGFEQENLAIHIGDIQTSTYIAGIYSTTLPTNSLYVVVQPDGQLGATTGTGGGGSPGVSSVTSLTSDIIVTPTTGAVTLNDNATSSDTFSTIVKRDGSGDFSATSVTLSGTLSAASVSGNGSGLTSLNASQLASGTVPSSVFSGTYSSAVTFNNSSDSFAGNGSGLTSLNAANLTGTVPSSVFSGTYSGAVTFNNSSDSFTGNGAGLTGVTAEYAQYLTTGAAIGAGSGNSASGTDAFIGGGSGNTASGAYSFIGGGQGNDPGLYSFVVGGQGNVCTGNYSGIGGGATNTIKTNANYSFIGAGWSNSIESSAPQSVISGGYSNTIQNSGNSIIGGGYYNNIVGTGNGATVGGGSANNISNSTLATIGGGLDNMITGGNAGTVSGGDGNSVNASYGTVGGGFANQTTGELATVPGGAFNIAGGSNSFAAGLQAQALHTGAFVWADSTGEALPGGNFTSTAANQFLIRAAGYVGINTNDPQAPLHVVGNITGNSANPIVLIENDNTTSNSSSGLRVLCHGNPSSAALSVSVEGSATSGSTNASSTLIAQFGNAHAYVSQLDQDGNWTATSFAGVFYGSSDRAVKENFQSVSPRDVLNKVSALPISRWNYKKDKGSEHIGPMAQDFYQAFSVGMDDKHIATVDEEGVALAAIQGLNQKVEEQKDQLKAKDAAIQSLEQRLERLEKLVSATPSQP